MLFSYRTFSLMTIIGIALNCVNVYNMIIYGVAQFSSDSRAAGRKYLAYQPCVLTKVCVMTVVHVV